MDNRCERSDRPCPRARELDPSCPLGMAYEAAFVWWLLWLRFAVLGARGRCRGEVVAVLPGQPAQARGQGLQFGGRLCGRWFVLLQEAAGVLW